MPTSLDRVFEAAGCSTQAELAKFLGIRQSTIASAKKKGKIPAEWLVKLLRAKRVNPEWVVTGQGARMLQAVEHDVTAMPEYVYVQEVRPPEECSMEELMTEVFRRVSKAADSEKV